MAADQEISGINALLVFINEGVNARWRREVVLGNLEGSPGIVAWSGIKTMSLVKGIRGTQPTVERITARVKQAWKAGNGGFVGGTMINPRGTDIGINHAGLDVRRIRIGLGAAHDP